MATELRVTLLPKSARAAKPNAAAYDMVLQAQFALQNGTPENIRRAREIMERALALAPDYAPAWGAMALVHLGEGGLAGTAEARLQANGRARRALARALELDPDLAIAHSRMASVQRDSWEFAAAERSIERALAADAKNPIVMSNAAQVYKSLGRLDEAITLEEKRLDADPLALRGYSSLASSYIQAGRLDEAEALLRKLLALSPDFALAHVNLGNLHLLRGNVKEARAAYARSYELQGGFGDDARLAAQAIVEHTAGNDDASAAAAAEFERTFGAGDPSTCARIRAWRGEADQAFAWLDKALAVRDPYLSTIKTDIYLRPVRADPRWNTLLQKIGLRPDR